MPTHSPNTGMECPAILLAEDEENAVALVDYAHQATGIPNPLICVKDGQEAIELLQRAPSTGSAPKLGLVLLDLQMPRKNGFEVLAWISTRPELKHLPVVVLSSCDEESDLRRARQLGAVDYRIKPTCIHELVAILQELHARWLEPPSETAPSRLHVEATPP